MTSQPRHRIKTLVCRICVLFFAVLAGSIGFAAPASAQNPVPSTNQPLVPDTIAPGGAGFTFTVNGAGFVPGSVVKWNGVARATSYVNSSQLTATILASDISSASTASITVVNPNPGGGTSAALFFPIRAPEASVFFNRTDFTSAGGNIQVVTADFDADGRLDLASAEYYGDSVRIFLGNGDGTFKFGQVYAACSAHGLSVGDFNGDGIADLAVADAGCGQVTILLGNGDATFTEAGSFSTGGGATFAPYSVAVGDFNHDGKLDLATANEGLNNSSVLIGNGDGTFQDHVDYVTGSDSRKVVTGDFNKDGNLDLAVSSFAGVSVLLGHGDGTFQPQIFYPLVALDNPYMLVADLNGDGRLDLAVVSTTGSVSILLGKGDGTFNTPTGYSTGGFSAAVAAADLNRDGFLDLVTTNYYTSNLSVLLGKGDGTFGSHIDFPAAYGARGLAIADFNRDGRLDLAVGNQFVDSISMFLGASSILSSTSTTLVSSLNPSLAGQAVTFTATVSSTAGIPSNGETITFKNGSTVLRTATLSGGMASLTTSSLAPGAYAITATYPGDGTFSPSSSPALRQVVNSPAKSATSTTLASSLNPSIYGQRVTLTAKVITSGPVPPTGIVAFMWKYFTTTYTIGSATLNSNGIATLSKANLSAYSYPMIAVYRGDANNLGSTSPVVNQVVKQTTSSASITSSSNPSARGQSVTFTARITSPTVLPTGPVTFTAGTTLLGSVQLSSGKASLTTSSLPAGSTAVKVSYGGNSNIKGSSAAITEVVQ